MRVEIERNQKIAEVIATPKFNEDFIFFYVFVVDATGSMQGSKYNEAIKGLKLTLDEIRKETNINNKVKIVEFEGRNIKTMLSFDEPIPTNYKAMGTGGMTPLNEAIGKTLDDTFLYIQRAQIPVEKYKVLVNIFTDGGENNSRGKYASSSVLSERIKELEEQNFVVTFMGTKNEVKYATNVLNLNKTNTLVHDNTSTGIANSYQKTNNARTLFAKKVISGQSTNTDFYEN